MDINNLIDRGGVLYAPNDNKPYTGIVFDFYENGTEKLNGRYRNGNKNGKWTWWYEDGGKDKTGSYRKGLMNGRWQFYYLNGKLKGRGVYKDGNGSDSGDTGIPKHGRTGKWTFWFENGQKQSEGILRGRIMIDLWTDWYESGQKKAMTNFKTRNGIRWYESGQKYVVNKKIGLDRVATFFYENGKKSTEIYNEYNIYWNEDGLMVGEGSMYMGLGDVWSKTYSNGDLIDKGYYGKCYNEDDIIESVVNPTLIECPEEYLKGWEGIFTMLHDNGNKRLERTYKDGELIFKECWDLYENECECSEIYWEGCK